MVEVTAECGASPADCVLVDALTASSHMVGKAWVPLYSSKVDYSRSTHSLIIPLLQLHPQQLEAFTSQ
jgi:hypothetical protein